MPISTISQTISTIPEAGRRGIDVQTVFVNKQEDFQDHLQGTTVTELNTLKTQMNTMAEEMNTTASQVNTNANTASTKASEASASATSASTSASTATTKASQASASATSASTSATSASSSATSATSSKNAAATSATNAANSASTATTKANEASASATSASNSATSASQSLDSINGILATLPDGTINDTLIGTDKAFSNQALFSSFGNLSGPLLDLPLKNSLAMKAGVGSTTFTRASTATYINRYGVLKTADIDEPRFEKEGYLNESASTNLLTYSEQFGNDAWDKAVSVTVVNTTDTLDPYGTNLAVKISKSEAYGRINQTPTVSVIPHTFSVFVKQGDAQYISLRITKGDATTIYSFEYEFSTKNVISSGSGSYIVQEISNGWIRLAITATPLDTTSQVIIYPDLYNTASTGSVYIFGAQLEALPFATSYIPTTDSAVTRAVENNSTTGYGNAPTKDEGTIYCRFKLLSQYENYTYIWSLYRNNSSSIRCYVSTGGYLHVRSSSANGGLISGNTPFIINTNQQYSVCTTWKDKLMKVYIDGVLAYQQSWNGDLFNTNLPSIANFSIGKYSPGATGLIGNGNYSSFKTYDKALTPTEIALLG